MADASSPPPPRGPPPGQTVPPPHIQGQNAKVYEVFQDSANALPDGSGQNTAGANQAVPTLSAGLKTIRLEDFKQVPMYPCVRESLLTGIGGGFALGGFRAVMGGGTWRACTWAVGTFMISALGSYEFCLYKRRLEKAHMKRAVEIIDRKKMEKEAQAELRRKERRRAKEEADRVEEERKKSWKFW